MNDMFKVIAPETVKELMEELFTGYINSPMCNNQYLGEIYELKRVITNKADEYERLYANAAKPDGVPQ